MKDVASLEDTIQINKTDTSNFMWYMVSLNNDSSRVGWISQNAAYYTDGEAYSSDDCVAFTFEGICKCRYCWRIFYAS